MCLVKVQLVKQGPGPLQTERNLGSWDCTKRTERGEGWSSASCQEPFVPTLFIGWCPRTPTASTVWGTPTHTRTSRYNGCSSPWPGGGGSGRSRSGPVGAPGPPQSSGCRGTPVDVCPCSRRCPSTNYVLRDRGLMCRRSSGPGGLHGRRVPSREP